jgi:hypothetical protein
MAGHVDGGTADFAARQNPSCVTIHAFFRRGQFMTARNVFILRALAVAALSIALASPAAFGQGADELWETSMSMQMEGMTMPAMNQKTCKKKGSTEENTAPLEKDCKVTDSKRSGNKQTFSFVCDGKDGKYGGSGETETLGKDFRTAAR